MKTNKLKSIICFLLFILGSSLYAQNSEYLINDIFHPDLRGPVKSFQEIEISQGDTIESFYCEYSQKGIRTYQIELRDSFDFKNSYYYWDTLYWKESGKYINAVHCGNESTITEYFQLGYNGLIEKYYTYLKTYGVKALYDEYKRLKSLVYYEGNDTINIFLVRDINYNDKGLILSEICKKPKQNDLIETGFATYSYDENDVLIELVTGSRKDTTTYSFSEYDKNGNFLKYKSDSGVTFIRAFEYYE